jgi:hypothetical protein
LGVSRRGFPSLYNHVAGLEARGLRSVAHGFATLEVARGFGIPLDLDESFDRLLRAFVAGLRKGEP